MKDILGITQYNFSSSYQAWKRMLALFKSIKSSRHNEICNLHKQIIYLLKALQRKNLMLIIKTFLVLGAKMR